MEYALGVALIGVVVLSAVEALEDQATDKLEERGASIGHPNATGSSTSTTTGSPPPPPSSSSSTTTSAYNPTFVVTCSGVQGAQDSCSFVLSPVPPAVPSWSILPATGFTDAVQTGNDYSVRFTAFGTFSVRATVDSVEYTQTVNCTTNGGKVRCAAT